MYWKVLPCFIAISAWISNSVDSDEAVKQGDEALNASSLQFLSSVKHFIASSLQFFLSAKCFIAVTFYRKTLFNTSSPLLFKRNS
jgi:hypothetical protein